MKVTTSDGLASRSELSLTCKFCDSAPVIWIYNEPLFPDFEFNKIRRISAFCSYHETHMSVALKTCIKNGGVLLTEEEVKTFLVLYK